MPQVIVSAAIERKVFEVCLYWLMLSHGQMLDKDFEHLMKHKWQVFGCQLSRLQCIPLMS